jgi:hypothetical protein
MTLRRPSGIAYKLTQSILDSNILVLGAAQTFFECSMYVFVLLYTPAIESAALTHFGKEKER